MRVSWSARSDSGLKRAVNEDAWSVRPELGLFIVADGMGGHAAGEVASRTAVEAIEAFTADTASADTHRTWPFPYDTSLSINGNRLKTALLLANRRIGMTAASEQSLKGMATTAAAVLVAGSRAVVAHVGDSRVYLLCGGRLQQITRDHSWVQEQVRAGILSESAAREHPWRNVVTRALAGGDDPEVDVAELDIHPGDRILLCSDGLSGVLTYEELAERVRDGDSPLDDVCRGLIDAANAGGGPDNITALLLQIDVP